MIIAKETKAEITSDISDGKPGLPPPEHKPIPFVVKSSVTRQVFVEEPAEMPELPASKGKINVTVQWVKDPGLTDPLLPLPLSPPDDPAVLARIAEMHKKYLDTELIFVSATVYDHSRTFVRCYPSGGGGRKEISGWSNLDFNHFSGFATYQVKGADGEIRRYGLIMGLGNEATKQRAEWLAKHDKKYEALEIPELPNLATTGPAFVITSGDTNDGEVMKWVEGMHQLYWVEGKRMQMAYQARMKANEERKAFLLANPPAPKDVTIRFWKRKLPSPIGMENLKGESKP